MIPSGPLLLVSPHLDDAVFSCAALVERTEPVDVLTVATGAPDPPRQGWWDVECGFGSSAESVPARLAEDEAAFAGTAHRRSYLDLLELQYQERRTGADRERIVDAVRTWATANTGAAVAVPVGAGCSPRRASRLLRRLARRDCWPPQHPDHVFVRDTVVAALAASEIRLLLYEEVPYLLGEPGDAEAARVASRLGRAAELVVVDVDPVRKAERIAAYASQLAHISPPHGRLDDPSTLLPQERYWLLRPATTAA